MQNVRRNGIDEPHTNKVQRKNHTDHMEAGEISMAPQEYPMARNHPGDDPRMWRHNPIPEQTKEEQSETTTKNGAQGSNPAPPNPPIGIGIHDMGPMMRKSHTGKIPIRWRNQSEVASRDQRKTYNR